MASALLTECQMTVYTSNYVMSVPRACRVVVVVAVAAAAVSAGEAGSQWPGSAANEALTAS